MKRIFYYAILVRVKALASSGSVIIQVSQYFLHTDLRSEIFLSSCCHSAAVTYYALRLVRLDKLVPNDKVNCKGSKFITPRSHRGTCMIAIEAPIQ